MPSITNDDNRHTYMIMYDDGVESGSCNPGWMVEWPIDSGNWEPIEAPYGPFGGLYVDQTAAPEIIAAAIREVLPGSEITLVDGGRQYPI